MRVSIITVCYNAVNTIEQTIKSVLGQSYRDIEYVIIDGKSTDGTLDILEKYRDKIAGFVSETDDGIYDAMNKGIRMATGEIVGIINADDWYEPTTVEHVVECFKKERVDIVHGNIRLIEKDGSIKEAPRMKSMDKLWHSMVIRHPATFVRKIVYEKYGLYNTKYKIAADYDFVLRCYAKRVTFFYLNEMLSNFRLTGISSTESKICVDETRRISLSYADDAPNREEIYKIINEQIKNEKLCQIFLEEPKKVIDVLFKRIPEIRLGIIIWGTGVWGKRCQELMKKFKIPIICFIDNDVTKHGKYDDEILVVSPDCIIERNIPVIIAIKKMDEELMQQIEKKKWKREVYITLEELQEELMNSSIC